MVLDDRAAPRQIAVQVDADHDIGAERARRRDRDRIDQRAVHQPAPAELHRVEDAGQGVGGAQRLDQRAMGQPDLVAGAEFGRDRDEARRQLLDADAGRDRARAGASAVPPEISPAPPMWKSIRPTTRRLVRLVANSVSAGELARGKAAADDGADRGSGDDVGRVAGFGQDVEHADMGPAARRAAAERQADLRPALPRRRGRAHIVHRGHRRRPCPKARRAISFHDMVPTLRGRIIVSQSNDERETERIGRGLEPTTRPLTETWKLG